jgi:ApbE superfamily uncharacterized protein (UPF0280 family)
LVKAAGQQPTPRPTATAPAADSTLHHRAGFGMANAATALANAATKLANAVTKLANAATELTNAAIQLANAATELTSLVTALASLVTAQAGAVPGFPRLALAPRGRNLSVSRRGQAIVPLSLPAVRLPRSEKVCLHAPPA